MSKFTVPNGGTIHFVTNGAPPQRHEWFFRVKRRRFGATEFENVIDTSVDFHAPPSNLDNEYAIEFFCRRKILFWTNWRSAEVTVIESSSNRARFRCSGFNQTLSELVVQVYEGPAED